MKMDSDQGKLFVGGISFETKEETLRDHFSKYGEVIDTVIMRDRVTSRPRGFGFVVFADPSVVDQALEENHVICSRTVEVKKAVPRGEQHQHYHNSNQEQHSRGFGRKSSSNAGGNNTQFRSKKIFVGGLSASVTEEEFRGYFEKFGRITDVVVMYDSTTHRPRGFGFITFDSEEAVESVMQNNFHELNNKSVEVKRAVPKDAATNSGRNHANNHNMRNGEGRGSIIGRYSGGYPTYNPMYNLYTGYGPRPVASYPYGAFGGYPMGGYGGVGFGAAPRSPWNGPGIVGLRRGLVPYVNAPFHPGYLNGGVGGYVGMTTADYHGIMGPDTNGKWNQGSSGDMQLSAGTSPMRLDGGISEDDSSGLMGSYEAAVGKQNQRAPGWTI